MCRIASTQSMLALVALVLLGCSSSNEPVDAAMTSADPTASLAEPTEPVPSFTAVAREFENQASAAALAMQEACDPLGSAVLAFLDSPATELQIDAQAAWHACYEHWQAFSLFHQVAFNPAAQDALDRSRRLINVRPFLPGYVDALPEYPYSGLVHETGMDLSLNNLLEQHQLMDLESPALGFPVVETLLWQTNLDTYWLTSGDDNDLTITRRHQYMTLATDHLLQQLEQARLRWLGQVGFTGLPEPAQRRIVLTSLGRQINNEVLELTFNADAIKDPDWHHPSLVAGQGKRHIQARLAGLPSLLSVTGEGQGAFATWADRLGGEVTGESLNRDLMRLYETLDALPDNIPAGNPDLPSWQEAVTALTALAEQINRLGESSATQNPQ